MSRYEVRELTHSELIRLLGQLGDTPVLGIFDTEDEDEDDMPVLVGTRYAPFDKATREVTEVLNA